MRAARGQRLVAATVSLVLVAASTARAQDAPAAPAASRRVAFDTVAGYQDYFAEDFTWRTQFIVDAFAGMELAPGWQLSARPVLWRVRGNWETLLDQASVRFETKRGANLRFEAGKFPAPIGLGLTENRANSNASVLWCHRPYYMPVPSLGADLPRVSLISAVYPLGGQASASTEHWDARAAIVDRPPVEFWKPAGSFARGANAIAGAGITPRQGIRFGVAGARGRYAEAEGARAALDYSTINAEADVAIGYTRLSGEWTRSRFESPGGTRASEGWTAQGQQTISARLFAHTRLSRLRSPRAASSLSTRVDLQRFRSVDSTLGYLLTPELTVRVAHTAIRAFGRTVTDHQLGVSVVWTRRWW